MGSSSAQSRSPKRPPEGRVIPFAPPEGENLESRVRSLLAAAAAEDRIRPASTGVMMDLTVNGYRCTVRKLPPPEDAAIGALSPREQEIARMVAKGYPNKMIAAVLEISVWTVGTYLRRIFAKLSVASRAAMVARLSRDGTET